MAFDKDRGLRIYILFSRNGLSPVPHYWRRRPAAFGGHYPRWPITRPPWIFSQGQEVIAPVRHIVMAAEMTIDRPYVFRTPVSKLKRSTGSGEPTVWAVPPVLPQPCTGCVPGNCTKLIVDPSPPMPKAFLLKCIIANRGEIWRIAIHDYLRTKDTFRFLIVSNLEMKHRTQLFLVWRQPSLQEIARTNWHARAPNGSVRSLRVLQPWPDSEMPMEP